MKRVLSWVLALLFGFSAFYVVYAHVASIATAKQYFEKPIVTTFANDNELRAMFETRGVVKLEGGEAHVDGKTTKTSFSGFATREIALTEGRLAFRFKVDNEGEYDVVLGVEKASPPHETISYVLHNGPTAYFGWEGQELDALPGLRSKGSPAERIDDKGKTPFAKDDHGQWHEVELQISTTLHRIAAFVDGVPTGSVFGEWIAGLPVRFVFGVRSRGVEDQPIDVRFSKLEFEPRAGALANMDFSDHFDGKLIDPRHWAVHSLNSEIMSVDLRTSKGGLVAQGKATPVISKPTPAFMLDTPETPLRRIHAKMVVDVKELNHALFFMGITSALGGAHLRYFDVGIHEGEKPKIYNGLVSGHWGRDGQGRFDPLVKSTSNGTVTLEVEFDAKTRIARAKMDGVVIGEHVSDLQMDERVRVRFGAVLDDAAGTFDVTVKELSLRASAD